LLENPSTPVPRRWSRSKVLIIAVVFGVLVTAAFLSLRLFTDPKHDRPKTPPVQGVSAGS
jgi:hypothetical protein